MVLTATRISDVKDFASIEDRGSGKVIVQFTADWCPRCAPLKEQLSQLDNNNVKWIVIDIDEFVDFIDRFKICTLPQIHIYNDGWLTDTLEGSDATKDRVNSVLKKLEERILKLNVEF